MNPIAKLNLAPLKLLDLFVFQVLFFKLDLPLSTCSQITYAGRRLDCFVYSCKLLWLLSALHTLQVHSIYILWFLSISEVDVEDRDETEGREQAPNAGKVLSSSPSPVQSLGVRPKIWSLVDTATEAAEGSPCASPSSSPRHPPLTPDQLLAASRLYGQHAQTVHEQWCQAFAQTALQQQDQPQQQEQQNPQQPLQKTRQRTPSPEAARSPLPS